MSLTQTFYRFGRAEGTESSHSWLAGVSRQVFRLPGLTASGDCLLRACVQADAAGATGVVLQWEYRHTTEDANGDPVVGAWAPIPADTSGPARVVNLSVFADGDNCTKRLAGTGTFTAANAGCTETGTVAAQDIAAAGCTESELAVRVINANTNFGDTLEFRLTANGQPLDGYDDLPTLRVARNVLAEGAYGPGEVVTVSTGVKKIRGAVLSYFGRLSDADVADPDLTIAMGVMGTTDPVGDVYDVPIYGPDTWRGGLIGKDGLPIYPQMVFAGTAPTGVRKVRASFDLSRAVTLSIDAGLVEGFASASRG